ncbi:MAG: bifunctional DNA-binding transcriptional regulator/O6-methylguanine-DNA methyltransferase Ada [Burkholderiales bacterium]|nr:bifunctional DNA-binding transcriptional regulator/O6-methylguanine-DNA methyltransferase Ada [Burkholderiales bacterium]
MSVVTRDEAVAAPGVEPGAKQAASAAAAVTADPRWAAVQARDAGADGRFVYSVSTTGVYCRPSCPSRRARPEHVRFHDTVADAQQAGFRSCRRCLPDGPPRAELQAQLVAAVIRHIEQADAPPSLDDLARQAGVSPGHLHRMFKAQTGLTPRAYAQALRARRLREQLDGGASVTDAIYAAGYGSNGRFYEGADAVLGMTPTAWRRGGADVEIRFAVGQTSLGAMLVARSPRGICAIALGDDPDALVRELQDRFPRAQLVGGDAQFEALVARVVGLVEAPQLGADLPLDVRGTAFQQRVWQALREIPPGQTLSYTELAQRIGLPQAVRAVAQACASNVLAVAIPCHRVVRQDGALSGYRWGVERKRELLRRESEPG